MYEITRNPYMVSIVQSDGTPYTGSRYIHKFGETGEVTLADNYDIWACPGINAGVPDSYPYQSSAFSLYAMSDDEADAGKTLRVEGLDANWDRMSVEVTLGVDTTSGGTTAALVGTASNWIRMFRAYNNGSTTLVGNVYFDPEATDATGNGVPDGLTNTQGCIAIASEQTLLALYTSADNERTYIVKRCAYGVDTTPGTPGSATIVAQIRTYGGVFRVQDVVGLHANGTSGVCIESSIPFYVPPRTDIRARIANADGLNRVSASFDMVVIDD